MKPVRLLVAVVAAAALAACASTDKASDAPPKASVSSSGSWAFAFDAGSGVASATLVGAEGAALVRLSCKAPNGEVQVADYTWGKAKVAEAVPVEFAIGSAKTGPVGRIAPATDGRVALQFATPSNDKVFRALTPNAAVSASTPTRTHAWAAGAATRINDMLNSCRATGS